jgi:hypothetical protein
VQEGPVPGSPFTPITPPGDPFGLTPSTGLAAGIPPAAAGLRVGPVTIYPSIGVGVLYDDNIYASNTNKKSSFGTIVSAVVRAEMRGRGGNVYGLTYIPDVVGYGDNSADNSSTQQLRGDARLIITTRARLSLRGDYLSTVDRRGTTDRPFGTEPDKRESKGVAGVFTYGAPGARGRIDVEAGHQELRYRNNRTTTAAFDYDTTFLGGAFYWRVMPKTSLLFRARQTAIDYALSTSDLDSTERQYGIGAAWEATAQTTGTFTIGRLEKDFDAVTRRDFTGAFWTGTVRWSPRTYSTFDLTTAQHTSETTGEGDFSVSRVTFVTWTHGWTSRTTSSVQLGYRNDSYRGAGVTRDDDIVTAGAGLNYQLRRWLRLAARYDYLTRSSNNALLEYDRNIVMLTVAASL